MKKLLAIVLAVVMCTAALLTFVSAESETIVYDIKDYFGKAETAPFSFGKLILADGTLTPLEAQTGTGKVNQYDAKEWTAYVLNNNNALARTDSDSVTDARFSKGAIWAATLGDQVVTIVFTAPAAGEYTFKMAATRWWDNNTQYGGTPEQQPCDITVKYGDTVNTAKLGNGTLSGNVTVTHTLAAGETVLLYVDPLGNGSGDNYTVNELTVTQKTAEKEPENPGSGDSDFTPVTYDFIDAFLAKDLEGSNFSPLMIHHVHGNIYDHYKWFDGTDANVKNAASGNALVGYRGFNSDEGAHNDVAYMNDMVVWYSPNQMDNIICFTAPVDGVYTYDFDTAGIAGWGGAAHSSMDFYIQCGEEVLHNANYAKGTAEADVATKWNGTVTLKAGDTIYFACSSGADGNSAGDNCVLNKLQVTLIEETKTEQPPKTNDALVAVIALAAVAGTALVISKKH